MELIKLKPDVILIPKYNYIKYYISFAVFLN